MDGHAGFFAKNHPDLKGPNRRRLYRMKQFYLFYKDDEEVSPPVTQLSWTHHLIIMSACKSAEECLLYMTLCIRDRYSKSKLQRQNDSGYYERYLLSQKPTTPAIAEAKRATAMYSSILTRLIFSTCLKTFPNAIFPNAIFPRLFIKLIKLISKTYKTYKTYFNLFLKTKHNCDKLDE